MTLLSDDIAAKITGPVKVTLIDPEPTGTNPGQDRSPHNRVEAHMTSRKTIAVEQVREWVNTRLAAPDTSQRLNVYTPAQAFRLGMASLLEQILHATGNYRGYSHTGDREKEPVQDDTRRVYTGPPRPLLHVLHTVEDESADDHADTTP